MMTEFEAQLRGERIATAEIVYFMPDHPSLLQAFTWQTQDLAPDYPRIHAFLDHWRREIEAVIHSVRVSVAGGVGAARFREVVDLGLLN
jgi:uncharacterized protein Usg